MLFEEQISASHPTRETSVRAWPAEKLAMRLVGERHSKRDLVNLVRWLILDNAADANAKAIDDRDL